MRANRVHITTAWAIDLWAGSDIDVDENAMGLYYSEYTYW